MKVIRSDCHNALMITKGVPDFIGDSTVVTVSYYCVKCNKPCNPVEVLQVKDWKKLDEN